MITQYFGLSISKEEYLNYYQGHAKWVIARAESGIKLKFPASWLSNFITHSGIHGRFALSYSEQGKLISLKQII